MLLGAALTCGTLALIAYSVLYAFEGDNNKNNATFSKAAQALQLSNHLQVASLASLFPRPHNGSSPCIGSVAPVYPGVSMCFLCASSWGYCPPSMERYSYFIEGVHTPRLWPPPFLGVLYGYYSVATGYNVGIIGTWILIAQTYLQSTDLKHLVLNVLQADALNRSSWCDCGNGGCPHCNLAVTIVLIKRSASVSASAERILPLLEERGVHVMQFWRKKEVQYAMDCAICPQLDEALRDLLHKHGVRPVSSSWVNIMNEELSATHGQKYPSR